MRVIVKGQGQGEGGRPTFAFFIWSICPCSAEISRQRSLFSRSRVAYSFCRFLSPRISSVRWRSRSCLGVGRELGLGLGLGVGLRAEVGLRLGLGLGSG